MIGPEMMYNSEESNRSALPEWPDSLTTSSQGGGHENSTELPQTQPMEALADLTPEQQVYDTNYKRFKKRFGEGFVKEVRGSLTEFLAVDGFAEKMQELIPVKHDATETLLDNMDYIRSTLRDFYSDKNAEAEQIPKNPYELARNVGYELLGPFDSAKEMKRFKTDYRHGERICTFNDPEGRLKAYHILWLRHQNADNIPPADELTAQNLTEEWQQYLRTINRYDQDSDTYNLQDLKPEREDPYGRSSMSVQIGRQSNNHVSIKNRYNHTVNSPDATLSNNLDNLTSELRLAVYSLVGRKDLMKAGGVNLANNYVTDNNGGIHRYYIEKDNVYYGWYEKIAAGEVTSLPENEYYRLSPMFYVKRNGGQLVDLSLKSEEKTRYTIEQTEGVYEMIDQETGEVLAVLCVETDEKQRQTGLSILVKEGIRALDYLFANNNESLTSLTIGKGAKVNNVSDNDSLTSLTIGKGAKVNSIANNNSLTSLYIAKDAKVGEIISNNPDIVIVKLDDE
ncbi:MAG: hypothetical protein LBH36_01170 [Candidatus Nomurabacteria bacterium]|jgi:hypothetical protein|nr:hypothetical protein [Candidatus Nomurabacteria bacterium]